MKMSTVYWCSDTDRRKWQYSEKNLSQCHKLRAGAFKTRLCRFHKSSALKNCRRVLSYRT